MYMEKSKLLKVLVDDSDLEQRDLKVTWGPQGYC